MTISISGTFLKFIDPILRELGYPDPERPEFDNAMKVGCTVWNAVVKNDVDNDPSFLKQMDYLIKPPFSKFMDLLKERKRRDFKEFSYFIGVCELRKKSDGSVTLYADARESSAARLQ